MSKLQWIRIVLAMVVACNGAAHSAQPADWFLASQQGVDGAAQDRAVETPAYDEVDEAEPGAARALRSPPSIEPILRLALLSGPGWRALTLRHGDFSRVPHRCHSNLWVVTRQRHAP